MDAQFICELEEYSRTRLEEEKIYCKMKRMATYGVDEIDIDYFLFNLPLYLKRSHFENAYTCSNEYILIEVYPEGGRDGEYSENRVYPVYVSDKIRSKLFSMGFSEMSGPGPEIFTFSYSKYGTFRIRCQ